MHHPGHLTHTPFPRPKLFRKKLSKFDRLILVVSVLYPLSGIPQLIEILNGHKEGVSLISWVIFLVCAGLFLTYGIRNKVFPMIITNSFWILIDSAIVFALIFL